MKYSYKELQKFAVDFAYHIHLTKQGDLSSEKHKELFDEWIKPKLPAAKTINENYKDQHLLAINNERFNI